MDLNLKLIRETRRRYKITQAQLAEAIGVHPSQMSRFETGQRRPHLDEARKMAEKLNLPLADIIGNGEVEPLSAKRQHSTITSLPLPEGRAVVEYPAGLSPKSREALKEWLELIARLAARE